MTDHRRDSSDEWRRNGVGDSRVRRFFQPRCIVWQSTGPAAPENAQALLRAGRGQAALQGPEPCVMRHQGSAPGVVLDFGKELHGGIQIVLRHTSNNRPVRFRVRFGESVGEAMGEPNNDHAIHDQIIMAPWLGAVEVGNTGFRFVRIDLVEEGALAELVEVRGVFLFRDDPWIGDFHCSDEQLNTIWRTGAYTVHLCMQDHLWDGIKRDRLVWMGDLHPETSVISAVFGEHEIVPRSLDFVRDHTPLPEWMNGMSSYSLWWLIIHRDWYRQHGNRNYLVEQRDYLLGLLEVLSGFVDQNGRESLPETRFLDWPTSGDPDAIHAGLQALLLMALDAGIELCQVLGQTGVAENMENLVGRMRGYQPPVPNSKQASALLALAGLADPVTINRNVLSREELGGISTFYGYYVLQARARAGDVCGALRVIRDYWGKMLELGATTFWEDFQLDWANGATGIDEIPVPGKPDIHKDFGAHCYKGLRHSLCHGWAAGPTAWLSEHILGFRPLSAGGGRLSVQPDLGDLKYAEGTWPTPKGPVKVRHERKASGKISTDIQAPADIDVC